MFKKGKRASKQTEFYKNRHFSRSLNDLYGHNILNLGEPEPEKDENYWSFGVSRMCMIA